MVMRTKGKQPKEKGSPLKRLRGGKKTKDKAPARIAASMIDLLPYRRISNDRDALIELKSDKDGYVDLLTIRGQGVLTMTHNAQSELITGFYHFLQAYVEDFKFIISPFPVDTSEQRRYWGERYARVQNLIRQEHDPRRQAQLRAQLRYISDKQNTNMLVEKKLVSEEFVLVIFGKTKSQIRQYRQAAINFGGKALIVEEMPRRKKEETLFRINNLNTRIR